MVEISNVWFSHGFPLGIRNFLLNKTQKVTCVTEEVATIISYSRPFIFCAIDYFRGNQSTSLNVKHTVIKLEFNKINVSNFEDALNNSSKSVSFGPSIPQFKCDSEQTLSLQLTIVATAVACPWIISLNMLVILAIKKVRELQKNSNILDCQSGCDWSFSWGSFYAFFNWCGCVYSSRNCVT